MIGGAPIQMQPGFGQPVYVRNPPQTFAAPAPPRAVPMDSAWPPAAPGLVAGPSNAVPGPKFRAKPDDEPSPSSRALLNRTIAIPSPEDLGVSNPRPPGADADRD